MGSSMRRKAALAERTVASRLGVMDQFKDALVSIRQRPLRAAAMSLGVFMGVAAAIATLSLTSTARFQVSDRFNTLRATQVIVQAKVDSSGAPANVPDGSVGRLDALSGVRRAGRFAEVGIPDISISASPEPGAATVALPRVVGSDAGYLRAVEAHIDGAGINRFAVDAQAHVAVVGQRIARSLGLEGRSHRLFIDGVPFAVVGIIDSAPGNKLLTSSVVIPLTVPGNVWNIEPADQFLIRVAPGAAPSVAAAAPYAIDPAHAGSFTALDPPDPATFKTSVDSDLSALGLGIAGIVAFIGIVAISSVTLAGVYERMEEFGLRRAIGARPSHLLRLVMTETALIGLASGLLGGILGVGIVLGVSASRNWVPVVDHAVVVIAPLTGALAGILAGVVPARRAAAIEPIEALRH